MQHRPRCGCRQYGPSQQSKLPVGRSGTTRSIKHSPRHNLPLRSQEHSMISRGMTDLRFALSEGVRDTKVDAEAIHQQNRLNPSVCVRKAAEAFVAQLGKLRPIVNRPDAALAPDGGGIQPPRRLPACPTSRQRFHFYVVHPSNSSLRWTSTKRTPRSRASTPEIDAR